MCLLAGSRYGENRRELKARGDEPPATGSRQRRLQGLQICADFRERGVELAGKIVQTGNGDQRNQGRDQGVLDQILAGFVAQKGLEKSGHTIICFPRRNGRRPHISCNLSTLEAKIHSPLISYLWHLKVNNPFAL